MVQVSRPNVTPRTKKGYYAPTAPLNLLPLTLYAAAGCGRTRFISRSASRRVGRAATTLLLLGVLVHTFVIGMQTMEVRHVPFSNTSTPMSSFVWMLALSYLYLEVTTDERAMGVFIVPILVGCRSIPAFNPGVDYRDPVLDSPWFWVHVTSLLFAYATFALAGVLGLTYVLQFKEIKKKHLGYFYTRLPSLHVLDAMNSRAVAVGWLFLTIGVVVGVVWAAQALPCRADDPNLRAMSLEDPKIFIAVLTWAVYSFAMFARRTLGVDRPARRVAVGSGLRDRVAQLPSRELLRHDEPHVPMKRESRCSAGHSSRRKPSHCAGRAARAARLLEPRSGRGRPGARARPSAAETVVLSTCNRVRDLRGQRRPRTRARGSRPDS